jgi:transcriptional regulator with XRE-family HTH domain
MAEAGRGGGDASTDPAAAGAEVSFGAWLSAAMRERGLSQAALARRIGVDDAQVSRWRRGLVVPSVGHLQRIAGALDVPRVLLDRIAGYPVPDEAEILLPEPVPPPRPEPPAGRPTQATPDGDRDPALVTEADAYGAWFARLLEKRVPPGLWRAYASACLALADGLTGGYADALDTLVRAGSVEPPRVTGDG